jgi:hypothetical protein
VNDAEVWKFGKRKACTRCCTSKEKGTAEASKYAGRVTGVVKVKVKKGLET